MKISTLLVVVTVLFIAYMLSTINTSADTPLTGYAHTKSHIIIGSMDGALTDYQVKFIVHKGSGTDNSSDAYLNGVSQSWPYDIRFTDSEYDLLSYWVESSDADTAVVWVKVPSIPAYPGYATVYLYYGRSGDSGASDGLATFDFFDDFTGVAGANIGGNNGWVWYNPFGHSNYQWKYSSPTGYAVQTIDSAVYNGKGGAIIHPGAQGNIMIEERIAAITDVGLHPNNRCEMGFSRDATTYNAYGIGWSDIYYRGFNVTNVVGGTAYGYETTTKADFNYHIYGCARQGTTVYTYYDGTLMGNMTGCSNTYYAIFAMSDAAFSTSNSIDWFRARQYTPNEPQHSVWGSNGVDLSVSGDDVSFEKVV